MQPKDFVLWMEEFFAVNTHKELTVAQFAAIYTAASEVKTTGLKQDHNFEYLVLTSRSHAGGRLFGSDFEQLLGDDPDLANYNFSHPEASTNYLRARTLMAVKLLDKKEELNIFIKRGMPVPPRPDRPTLRVIKPKRF